MNIAATGGTGSDAEDLQHGTLRQTLVRVAKVIAGLAVLSLTAVTFMAWAPVPWVFPVTGPLLWLMARASGRGWRWLYIVFAAMAAWLAGSGVVWVIDYSAGEIQTIIGTLTCLVIVAVFIRTTKPKES